MYVCILIILYLFTCYCLICGLLCILYILFIIMTFCLQNESGTCKLKKQEFERAQFNHSYLTGDIAIVVKLSKHS